jgi:phage shock protein E
MNKRNIRRFTLSLALVLTIALVISGCATTNEPDGEETPTVMNITAEQGKAMMDEDSAIILVDVRTQEEYSEEHIPNALLVPVDELESLAPNMMPDKDATYIIYCRSGNRSATAAQNLVELGYMNIYDMGGIIDWPYDTVSGD